MSKKKTDKEKLRLWQERLSRNDAAYSAEEAKMNGREALYRGSDKIKPVVENPKIKKTPHVRNICAEIIEAQVSSSIPKPKVAALRPEDEAKAKLIEDMLRNELDRLPFEEINDMMERTVPIQGGAAFLLEWDNSRRTQHTVGEISVSTLHPKQIIPQDGVYTGIEDMDYIILKVPQTKEYIARRYGVDVQRENEEEPDIKGGDEGTAEDLVTQYVAYYRNKNGGIGLYSWVGDVQLEDLEDYQARRLRHCKKCGQAEPMEGITPIDAPSMDGTRPGMPAALENEGEGLYGVPGKLKAFWGEDEQGSGAELPGQGNDSKRTLRGRCAYCGAQDWEEKEEEYEKVYVPIQRRDGSVIPGASLVHSVSETEVDPMTGLPLLITEEIPTFIPWYKPDIFPVILQKNVSVYGKFLGDSDIDKIETQQNTANRLSAKIIEKLIKSGSYMTLPDEASIRVDEEDLKIIRPGSAADKQLIEVYDMQANISQDMAYLEQVYQEARQIIGITDSFQGRADRTATSGKAKEFAAAQSAGRLESKRVMKDAAYATLFEAIFKFRLAYTDEPRPVLSKDIHGNTKYDTFSRYDFLEKDEAGQWYWNDQFLFSCDTTAPLASNREAMWQETRMNLQTGAFGDPASLETLISFWEKMEALHYPTAGETKQELMERLQKQMQMQQQQMQMQREMQMREMQAQQDAAYRQEAEGIAQSVAEDARRAAERDMQMQG